MSLLVIVEDVHSLQQVLLFQERHFLAMDDLRVSQCLDFDQQAKVCWKSVDASATFLIRKTSAVRLFTSHSALRLYAFAPYAIIGDIGSMRVSVLPAAYCFANIVSAPSCSTCDGIAGDVISAKKQGRLLNIMI
jgi:hypothetical protein